MLALFFEVTPKPGEESRYLEIAASLKPELEASGGVAFLDRFRSLTRPRVMLSHQLWQDEASLARWRANGRHHGAQRSGRSAVFEDYRLRVGTVIASAEDGRLNEWAPGISYNDPARQAPRFMVVVRSSTEAFPGPDGKSWRSVYDDGRYAWAGSVGDRDQGMSLLSKAAGNPCVSAAQLCLVSRDYGMFDRSEAPQYFPEK